jgi:choice-of-anchor C domain-containing protein
MREIGPSRTLRLLCLALLAITLLPLHKLERVQANASLINGSFESPGVSISTLVTAGSTFLTGWAVTQGSIEILPSQNWQASDGQFSLDLSGLEAGTIAQTLDTIAGRSYLVTFDLGGNPDHPELGTIKQLQVSTASHSQIYTYDTLNSPPLPAMIWARHAFQFVATGASTTLEFRSLINTAFGPTLDNVSVTEFDTCLQDDTNGSTLLINSVKGDYNFTRNVGWADSP